MNVLCVAVLMLIGQVAVAQMSNGGPRLFSYQGLVVDKNGNPMSGHHTVMVGLWEALSGGGLVYQETHTDVVFTNGVFDLNVGAGATQLPNAVTFDRPYWIEIITDPGGANEIRFLRQQILSAPYAFNSLRAGGIAVSAAPVAGNIFPIPMQNGKVDPSFLPPSPAAIQSINTVGPNNNDEISILAGGGIVISNNPSNHTVTIGDIPDTILAGPGLNINGGVITPPPSGRTTVIGISNDGITPQMIGPGVIGYNHLADGIVFGSKIPNGAITQDKIAPATDYAMVAVGTTTQRPTTPVAGMIRFNTTTKKFEGYDGTSWVDLN
jgi:hypothetical protein